VSYNNSGPHLGGACSMWIALGKEGIIKFVKKRKGLFFFFSRSYEQNGLEIIDIVADRLSCLVMNEKCASKYVLHLLGHS